MTEITGMALFCEDIRQEANKQVTIVGVLPDGLHIPSIPGFVPKLCMYIRLHVPVDVQPRIANLYVKEPTGKRVLVGEFDEQMIRIAQASAKDMGLPMAGLINAVIASPFQVEMEGVYAVEMDWGDRPYYLGNLMVGVPTSPDQLPSVS